MSEIRIISGLLLITASVLIARSERWWGWLAVPVFVTGFALFASGVTQ